jgi:hypothetical protein
MLRLSIVAALIAVLFASASATEVSLRHIPESVWEDASTARPAAAAFQQVEAGDPAGPSVGRAVLYSLVLPGWGDYYAGRTYRARYFFIAEAAIWTSFAVFRLQGSQDEEAYQDYAVQFAGVERTDHSDDYYAELRQWDSSADYEAYLKTEGRPVLFPDVGSTALQRYFEDNRLADYEAWEWQSFEHRLEFSRLRSASKNAYRRSMFAIAAAGVNRVVAAVFAYQAVKSQREGETQGRYHIDFTPPARYAARYDAAVSIVRTF